MSGPKQEKQKSAQELCDAFTLMLETTFYQDLVAKWGSQYCPTTIKLSPEEIENLELINSYECFFEDVKEQRAFFSKLTRINGRPESFKYQVSLSHLIALKEKLTLEKPICDELEISKEVETILINSGVLSWYVDSDHQESREAVGKHSVLSPAEVDALLGAVIDDVPAEAPTVSRQPVASEQGFDKAYIRVLYEFHYLYGLARRGRLYRDLFKKRAQTLSEINLIISEIRND